MRYNDNIVGMCIKFISIIDGSKISYIYNTINTKADSCIILSKYYQFIFFHAEHVIKYYIVTQYITKIHNLIKYYFVLYAN